MESDIRAEDQGVEGTLEARMTAMWRTIKNEGVKVIGECGRVGGERHHSRIVFVGATKALRQRIYND
jgi:hypothetical protein